MNELLLKLLGAPDEKFSGMTDAALALRGSLSAGTVAGLALLLVGIAFWAHFRGTPGLSPARRGFLATIRALFFLLLLLLLARPVLTLGLEGTIRRILVLLIDTSGSMQIRDQRVEPDDLKRAAIARNVIDPDKGLSQPLDPSAAGIKSINRIELARAVLANPRLKLLPALQKKFDLALFSFGSELAEIPAASGDPGKAAPPAWLDALKAGAPTTALGEALRELVNRKRGQPLAGIFVVSDGANNSGTPPAEVAAQLRQEKVPLYIYGTGITSPRDIIVAQLAAPEISFVSDDVPVTVRVKSQGMKGLGGRLVLKLGGAVVAEQAVEFSADGEQAVSLRFTPPVEGNFELEASIAPRDDETVKENNVRSQHLRVVDTRIKVLLVDQAPRWEFRYLQAMLMRDRRIDLRCVLFEADPAVTRGNPPPYLEKFPVKREELFAYDMVIFGDVDPRQFPPAQMEQLSEFVSRFGGAVVVLAGKRFTPAAYHGTELEKMLPVELEGEPGPNRSDRPVRLELTAAGQASPMLQLAGTAQGTARLWAALPPVYWTARVARGKPAAEILAVDPDPEKASRFGKMPVIALQQYGLGQVLYIGTDNLWRWRKNSGDLYHTIFWGQISQRVSLPHMIGGSKLTQITSDRQNYMTGERVTVFARLYSAAYNPLQDLSVRGFFQPRAGAETRKGEVVMRAMPGKPGFYRGEFIAPPPGGYQFHVETDPSTRLHIDIAAPRFEGGETAMNEAGLRELAARSGGAFFREEDLHQLPGTIESRAERVRSTVEVELWASPLYFLILLGLVTTEWIVRKRSHLK